MELTVENIQLVLAQRIPPAWADREPPREIDTASKLDMKATRELRKLLLLKERTALRIINGAENKVWITEAQRFRMKLTNSPACTLCGTHDDTHTLVDTVCPVSMAVKLQWQMAASQPAAQAEWTWRLLVSTEDEMTAPRKGLPETLCAGGPPSGRPSGRPPSGAPPHPYSQDGAMRCPRRQRRNGDIAR